MRIQKHLRELMKRLQPVCDELQAEITDITPRGSGHWRITVDFGGGAVGFLTVANSPSDFRVGQNVCRDLRKEAGRKRGGVQLQ